MRYFLIGSENGSPVYFDHPQGRMMIPPMVTMQEVLEEMFRERATGLRGDPDVVLVTAKWQGYVLGVVTDQSDDEVFLRSQLYAVFRLLLLKFGPNALRKGSPYFLRHKDELQRLIDLCSHSFATQQSSLVHHAAEHLDVNRELLKTARLELQKALRSLPNATHGILFVGSKILAMHAKNEWMPLHPQDVFLLWLAGQAEFHPIERVVEQEDVPVADYTDHPGSFEEMQAKKEEGKKSAEPEDEDESFVLVEGTSESLFNESDELSVPWGALPRSVSAKEMDFLLQRLQALFAGRQTRTAAVDVNRTRFDFSESCTGDLYASLLGLGAVEESQSEETAVLQFALFRLNHFAGPVDGLPSKELKKAFESFQIARQLSVTGELDQSALVQLFSSPEFRRNDTDESVEDDKSSTSSVGISRALFLRLRLRQSTKNNSQSSTGSEESYTACQVHFSELDAALTLVVVSRGEQEERLSRVRNYLRSRRALGPYLSFFVAKEHTHLSMLSYAHQYPGLVHFLLIDRVSHRLLAPSLLPLWGQSFEGRSEMSHTQHTALLHAHVWQMCSLAQQQLREGILSSLLLRADFNYFHELWAEDHDRHRLSFDSSFSVPSSLEAPIDAALDASFFSSLLARQFPGKNNVRCFEIHCLYLGSISSATLKKYNELLLAQLRSEQPTFFA